ncbi:MAG: double zinc ribbon domain-containing protein, partial [Spirochaetaceae bacterium]|nr:double zinc ribbon domain-containing protein [Spirochaetaceae bacterium]
MNRCFDFPFLAALLRERLFPAGCALCGKTLLYRDEIWEGLCAACASRFPVEEGARCRRCGKLLISEREMCLSCREEESVLDGAFSLYPYTGRFRELLSAWKFGKNLALGNLLARRLLAAASRLPLPPDACWVPVPPRPGKIHDSGWDQIVHLASCLRRPGPGHSGVPVRPCLRRLSSKKQKELNRR